MEQRKYLRRAEASAYLKERHDTTCAPATLAKKAVLGGGPVFEKHGHFPVYTPAALDAWAAARKSAPMASTSARAA